MNKARIVVLAIALGAGAVALYLASASETTTPATQVAVELPTVEVLVAKSELPLGHTITANDIRWQVWPASAASVGVLRRNDRNHADTEIVGMMTRSTFVEGEPIREIKLVRTDGAGFMAAVLTSGMRAVSTEISPETGAGGFILPNDRVDVLLSKRDKSADRGTTIDVITSEVILSNIRVLAIDQAPKEKDGQNTVVGKTATLEVKPEQAETLAQARQSGTLSLALRALADANLPDVQIVDRQRKDSVNVIRYGIPTQTFSK